MTYVRVLSGLGAAALVAMVAGGALAQSNPEQRAGQTLARQWCVSCHTISETQRRTTDAAPTLPSVARRTTMTDDRLRAWLSTPHAGMPDLSLRRDEIDALIAYLASFRP